MSAAKEKTVKFFTIMTLIVMACLCAHPPAASSGIDRSKTRYDFLTAQNLKTALGGIRKKSAHCTGLETMFGPANTGVKWPSVTTIALEWTVKFNRPNLAGGTENQTFDRSAPTASIGNIVSITGGDYAGARTFNDIHQLTGVGGNVQLFDGAGNLTTSASGTTFTWNVAASRLTSATVNGDPRGISGTHSYGYDATGRRAWKEVGGSKTVFIYSGPNIIAEYNAGSSASSPSNEYIYSGGIDSLTMVAFNNNAKRLVAHRNQQWSIVGLVDFDTQALEEQYAYNVFGERTILDDVGTVRTSSSFNNRYGYTSREHDDETGLMHFRARMFDPTTGEFISQDPSAYVDGMSLYRGYMGLSKIDPNGLAVRRNGKNKCHPIGLNSQFVTNRGFWNQALLGTMARGTKWLDSRAELSWKRLPKNFEEKGCCCCDELRIVQIARTSEEWVSTAWYTVPITILDGIFRNTWNRFFDWHIDRGPNGFYYDVLGPWNPCKDIPPTPSLSDGPGNRINHPFGSQVLVGLRQDFETCIVCSSGIEGPKFQYRTYYGCITWGHTAFLKFDRYDQIGRRELTTDDYWFSRRVRGFSKFGDKDPATIGGGTKRGRRIRVNLAPSATFIHLSETNAPMF